MLDCHCPSFKYELTTLQSEVQESPNLEPPVTQRLGIQAVGVSDTILVIARYSASRKGDWALAGAGGEVRPVGGDSVRWEIVCKCE
jgi:hypothetical protein